MKYTNTNNKTLKSFTPLQQRFLNVICNIKINEILMYVFFKCCMASQKKLF